MERENGARKQSAKTERKNGAQKLSDKNGARKRSAKTERKKERENDLNGARNRIAKTEHENGMRVRALRCGLYMRAHGSGTLQAGVLAHLQAQGVIRTGWQAGMLVRAG